MPQKKKKKKVVHNIFPLHFPSHINQFKVRFVSKPYPTYFPLPHYDFDRRLLIVLTVFFLWNSINGNKIVNIKQWVTIA